MDDYVILFNIMFEPFRGWWLMSFASVGAALIGGAWALNVKAKAALTAVGAVFVLGGCASTWIAWSEYSGLRDAFRSGRTSEIEGQAQHRSGRFDEVSLGSEHFRMGPMQTAAYNRPINEGGVNLDGRCVKIFYAPNPRFASDNAILWIAIKRTACDN